MTATDQCPAHADLEAEIETLRGEVRELTERVDAITPAQVVASIARSAA